MRKHMTKLQKVTDWFINFLFDDVIVFAIVIIPIVLSYHLINTGKPHLAIWMFLVWVWCNNKGIERKTDKLINEARNMKKALNEKEFDLYCHIQQSQKTKGGCDGKENCCSDKESFTYGSQKG